MLSGVLAFGAFPPLDLSFLAWVSFVPLFFVIKESDTKEAFFYSYLAGIVFFGSLLSWLFNVTVPGTIILVLIMGAYYAVFGVAARLILKYSMNLFILPFFWVIIEYIRAHLFSGFLWGMLAYSQYRNINLIQLADIMGPYGISFVVMTFNAALFAVAARSKRKISYIMFALLFIITATSYGMYRLDNLVFRGSPRISVVQGNIPQRMKWDENFAREIMDTYSDLTVKAASERPDMIVWPETSYPYLAEKGESPAPDISGLSADLATPILAGLIYERDGTYFNSAVLFDGDDREAEIYNKLHLVPFGEYVPFEKYFRGLRGRIDKPIGDFGRGEERTIFTLRSLREEAGADGSLKRSTTFFKFGVLICFEDVFPYLSRDLVHDGANILVNITNDAWFGDTAAARQHVQSSVFRAVENRVPVIRAANTGISCFIDPTGKIVSGVSEDGREIFVRGYDTATVKVAAIRSYYTLYGDTFVYFSGFLLILLLISETLSMKSGKREF